MAETMPIAEFDIRPQLAPLRGKCREALDRVIESQTLVGGPEAEALERETAARCKARHAIACASHSHALRFVFAALQIGRDADAVVSAFGGGPAADALARAGAQAVAADTSPLSMTLSPQAARQRITPATRAIVLTHLHGQFTDAGPLLDMARSYGLPLIEDGGDSFGAERRGGAGLAVCYSLAPGAVLSALGQAGLIITQDETVAARIRNERERCQAATGGGLPDAVQAALLRVQIPCLDRWIEERQRSAAFYNRLFLEAGVGLKAAEASTLMEMSCEPDGAPDWMDKVVLPIEQPASAGGAVRGTMTPFPGHAHIYSRYVIRTARRDTVSAELARAGIGHTACCALTLPKTRLDASRSGVSAGFPAAECAARTALALPIFPGIAEAQIREVVAAVVRGLRKR